MSEHVDAVAFLRPGARPSRRAEGEPYLVAKPLPTPTIARPTVWTASQQSTEEVLAGVEELAGDVARKELLRLTGGVRLLLAWLHGFPGESWQQRWLASGADAAAGKAWTDLVDIEGMATELSRNRRYQATGAASRLILLDVIRPGYDWLYGCQSNNLYHHFPPLRDPAGFAALEARCKATQGLRSADQRAAFIQLARILMHNGGTLAQISVPDCVEAYRAQTSYIFAQHSHWYTLLRDEGILGENPPPTISAQPPRPALDRGDGRRLRHQVNVDAGLVRGLPA